MPPIVVTTVGNFLCSKSGYTMYSQPVVKDECPFIWFKPSQRDDSAGVSTAVSLGRAEGDDSFRHFQTLFSTFSVSLFGLITMGDEWDSKLVIGSKKTTPKVAKKDSDLNAVCRHNFRNSYIVLTVWVTQARRNGAVVATDKKMTAGTNKAHQGTDHQRIAKLDRENEVAPPPKIAPSVGRAIQAARMELKLSQKDVAQKINEKPSVVQDYEASKAIPNAQVLGKLERVLGVKLRGSEIGKKLEGPKKP
ncbi:hypothetical protein AX15_002930 [Amanita polypyramis BW_CC]|nr:hypothetical protein AX15_002930 [Amanita polypyramis BW_CC]